MIDDVSQMSREAVTQFMDQLFKYKTEHQNKIHVLKPSGKILESGDLRREFAKEVVRMKLHLGLPVVVIHGAGKQIDAALKAANMVSRRDDDHLRISEAAHIPIIDRATRDANDLLCEEIYKAGEGMLTPEGMPGYHTDLNMVGTAIDADNDNFSIASLRSMNPYILRNRIMQPLAVPVLTNMIQLDVPSHGISIGNGNADTIANGLAGALNAYRLYLCSDVPGVLEQLYDPKNKTDLKALSTPEIQKLIADGVLQLIDIKKLNSSEVQKLIKDGILRVIDEIKPNELPDLLARGTITGGMVLKLKESFQTATVMGPDSAVVIMDHNISAETVTKAGWGTAFYSQMRLAA